MSDKDELVRIANPITTDGSRDTQDAMRRAKGKPGTFQTEKLVTQDQGR